MCRIRRLNGPLGNIKMKKRFPHDFMVKKSSNLAP